MDTIAQIFIALGTVSVAILAIWGDRVRALLAGPKLELTLRDPRGDLTTRQNGTRTIYYHITVSNRRKWSPATSVRVLVTQIAKRRPDGSFFPESLVAPLQLTWVFPTFHELLPTIKSDDTCDLGFLDEGAGQFQLSTYVTPANFQGFVRPSEALRVQVIAVGHNYQSPKPLNLEVAWDGHWSTDPATMERHLVVREVS